MDAPVISILVTIVLGVSGWIAGHSFNSKRDQANKRRDIRLERLLKCYDILAKETVHRSMGEKQKVSFENALSELQLIGTELLIELSSSFNVNEDSGNVIPILELLRVEIRQELGLKQTKKPFMWFRFSKKGRWTET